MVCLLFCGYKNICLLVIIQKILWLLVGVVDGYLYMYNLDFQEGGECVLMKQYWLDGSLEMINEILDFVFYDCFLVIQIYGVVVGKGIYVFLFLMRFVYIDDLGVVGGVCLEDEVSVLCLDEDSEYLFMIFWID